MEIKGEKTIHGLELKEKFNSAKEKHCERKKNNARAHDESERQQCAVP